MVGVSVQRRLRFELGIQDHITGVINPAAVNAYLQVHQTRYTPPDRLKAGFNKRNMGQSLIARAATDIPHDDVLDHDRGPETFQAAGANPAFWGQRFTKA